MQYLREEDNLPTKDVMAGPDDDVAAVTVVLVGGSLWGGGG